MWDKIYTLRAPVRSIRGCGADPGPVDCNEHCSKCANWGVPQSGIAKCIADCQAQGGVPVACSSYQGYSWDPDEAAAYTKWQSKTSKLIDCVSGKPCASKEVVSCVQEFMGLPVTGVYDDSLKAAHAAAYGAGAKFAPQGTCTGPDPGQAPKCDKGTVLDKKTNKCVSAGGGVTTDIVQQPVAPAAWYSNPLVWVGVAVVVGGGVLLMTSKKKPTAMGAVRRNPCRRRRGKR